MLWRLPSRWQNTNLNFMITFCISFLKSLQWWKWKVLTLGTRPTVLLITELLLIDFLRSEPDLRHYLLVSPTLNAVILILLLVVRVKCLIFSTEVPLCEQIWTKQFIQYSVDFSYKRDSNCPSLLLVWIIISK